MRIYKYGRDTITRSAAIKRFPDPAFFNRPDDRMDMETLRAMLHRDLDEVIRILEQMYRPYADGSIIGNPKKISMRQRINQIHDIRVGFDIIGGLPGRPYLWEE